MNDETILNESAADAAATKVGGRSGRGGLVALGALMSLASCGLSAFVAEPSHEFYVMNRGLVALGGGLAAGGMLGFLDVDLRLGGSQSLRGGGGSAPASRVRRLRPSSVRAALIATRARSSRRRAGLRCVGQLSLRVQRRRVGGNQGWFAPSHSGQSLIRA